MEEIVVAGRHARGEAPFGNRGGGLPRCEANVSRREPFRLAVRGEDFRPPRRPCLRPDRAISEGKVILSMISTRKFLLGSFLLAMLLAGCGSSSGGQERQAALTKTTEGSAGSSSKSLERQLQQTDKLETPPPSVQAGTASSAVNFRAGASASQASSPGGHAGPTRSSGASASSVNGQATVEVGCDPSATQVSWNISANPQQGFSSQTVAYREYVYLSSTGHILGPYSWNYIGAPGGIEGGINVANFGNEVAIRIGFQFRWWNSRTRSWSKPAFVWVKNYVEQELTGGYHYSSYCLV